MNIRLRTGKWKVRFKKMRKDDGRCIYAERKIIIDPRVRGKKAMEIWIHELLHACLPDLDEAAIDPTAENVVDVLWKQGYRPKGDGRGKRWFGAGIDRGTSQ